MLPAARLAKAIREAPLVLYTGLLYRAVQTSVLYPRSGERPRPLYALGSSEGGARYTPKGGVPALYAAEDVETSSREYLEIAGTAPLKPKAKAFTTYTIEVRLEGVLDLTDEVMLALLGTSLAEIGSPWRHRQDGSTPPTQILGRVASKRRDIQAIRFKSTKGAGPCFAIFTQAIVAPAFVRVEDPESGLVDSLP